MQMCILSKGNKWKERIELSFKYKSDILLIYGYKYFSRHLRDWYYSRFSFLDLNNSGNGIAITFSKSLNSLGFGALSVFHNHLDWLGIKTSLIEITFSFFSGGISGRSIGFRSLGRSLRVEFLSLRSGNILSEVVDLSLTETIYFK